MTEGTGVGSALTARSQQAGLDTLAENDPVRSAALRRWAYVRRVLVTWGLIWNAASLVPVIAAVAASLKDKAAATDQPRTKT